MDNQAIARILTDHARRLEREQGNLYRVKAYRRAAEALLGLAIPVHELLARDGIQGLRRLPGIGSHLAYTIERLATTNSFHGLVEGIEEPPPDERVENLPGIGPHLAQRLWERLSIRSIPQLAEALANQQLQQLHLGDRRQQHIAAAVEQWQNRRPAPAPAGEPSVAELLHVDQQYRNEAEEGGLPRIAPDGQNPDRLRWLPLLSTRRGGWKYRALFSNTALAHRLGLTHDWVVIYFQNETGNGQRTVVTEYRGDLCGRRVVRGREDECRLYYQTGAPTAARK